MLANMNLHHTWREISHWTGLMAKLHGGTVHDTQKHKIWDWGQALCRELYGFDWMNSEEFKRVNDIPSEEPAPANIIQAARKWQERDGWPKWVAHPITFVCKQYLPFVFTWPTDEILDKRMGKDTLRTWLVDATWDKLSDKIHATARYLVLDEAAGDSIETVITPFGDEFSVRIMYDETKLPIYSEPGFMWHLSKRR